MPATWVVLMMILSLTVTVAAEANLTSTVNVSGLTVNSTDAGDGSKDWSGSAGGVSWSGTSSGGSCSGYIPQKGKLVLTNNSGETKVLSFDYTLSLGGGSVSIDGVAATANSSFKKALESGKSVEIVTSSKAGGTGTTTVELSNIQLEVPNVTVTFNPASNGSYTVDGAAVTASIGQTVPATKTFALVATPAEHCVFEGWYLDGALYNTGENIAASFPNGGTITAKFVQDPLYTVAVATGDYTKDQLVEINSRYYHNPKNSLKLAQSSASTECFYSVAATTGVKDDWEMQHVPFLSWSASNTAITATYSGTAQGEWCTPGSVLGSNSYAYANMVANVIRIQAKEDCIMSFAYSNSVSPVSGETNGPFLRIYESLSGAETYANILSKGTQYREASGELSIALAKGKYLYICMNGKACDKQYIPSAGGYGSIGFSYTGTISNFTVSYNELKYTQTTTFQDNTGKALNGGKLTAGSTTYTAAADGSIEAISLPAGQAMKLSVAQAPANYKLLGWSVDGNMVYTPTYEYVLNADTVINPVFVPNAVTFDAAAGTYQYRDTAGATVNLAGQYIARNRNATAFYTTLADAFAAESEVVLLGSMTINGDYEIPAGKTLIVPRAMTGAATWDSSNNRYISGEDTVSRSVYATLTVNNNLTVNGGLLVDGAQYRSNGSLYGPYGVMTVKGSVTLNNGAGLYGFGVVNGSGTIYANSGAKVHECMEFMDMRHPVTLKNLVDATDKYNLFFINSIHIYSIEADVIYSTGATLDGHYFNEYTGHGSFPIINTSKAMFIMNGGTLSKSFRDGRITVRINEGGSVSTGAMQVKMNCTAFGMNQDLDVDTSKFIMPLTAAFHIQVAGNFALNHNYKMLPGSKLDITSSGVMEIGKGANLILYRLNDYDYRRMYDVNVPTGFSAVGYPINYGRYTHFNISTIGSAKLNVDGTLNVNGGLYVTDQLIPEGSTNYTYYANGYNFLTGGGTIDMSSQTGQLTQIYENLTFNQSQDVQPATVAVVPVKGLKMDATADEAAQYESLSGLVYGLTNENGLNVWVSDPCANGHTLEKIEEIPVTCTENGNREYYTCSVCSKYFSDAEGTTAIEENSWIIETTGHTLAPTEAKDATCIEDGNYAYWYCETCQKYFKDEVGEVEFTEEDPYIISALGHTQTDDDNNHICDRDGCEVAISTCKEKTTETPAKEPTCSAEGNVAYWTCSVCGKFYSDAECTQEMENGDWVIIQDPNKHTYNAGVIDPAPTCTTAGTKTYTCSGCGNSYTEEVAASGHSYTESVTKAPGCTEAGEKTFTCVCGDTYTEEIAATGHSLTQVDAKAPTCTEAGYEAYEYCTVCDYTTYVEKAATGVHIYENGVCTGCGDPEPSTGIEINVEIVGTANKAEVTGPADGWKEGTNTFYVSNDLACVVVVSYDNGETYERLPATKAGDRYAFTAENMTEDTLVKVMVKADANADGYFSSVDVANLLTNVANSGKLFSELQKCLFDNISAKGAADLLTAIANNMNLEW